MRRSATATTAAALAALLLLAGCSSDEGDAEPADTPTATETETASADAEAGNAPEDVAALEGVTVEGEPGAEATLTFEQPLDVSGAAAAVASPGDGEEIAEGQLLLVDFTQVNGENGEVLDSTYEGEPQPLVVSDEMTVPALNDVLIGQQVGARVLFASPTQAAAAIMTLEVVDARSRAEGTAVEVPEGVPTVTLAENGEPSIEPVDGEAPTELVVAPTIEGEGKEVEEGDYVFVQYSGWLWDGTSFDSSWSRGSPFSLEAGAGQVIEGWDTGLLGQTVGSQVVMVIPPELGYGDQDNGTIPPGSTLVFVVDILYAG
ncbi:peptidylprolyl isomerase [Georgenia satyanarayanai]|uniref:Peptidyl-prolyl cis-trans isomerase n=1 Tax=Georgenia satyanarayanai TaxID=860221 RepID=A0A2Y9AC24_9MICO|nr:FKBP-type peptidyl-prolyl cis-trans isomerase [Georgenia satyanarayanai]PYG00478.1 peptidylprolyl isomerase [Georgenia satyanarayanai]SSA39867.1 peptidylprolyl isomerase [Georgenia satyanarayanai]